MQSSDPIATALARWPLVLAAAIVVMSVIAMAATSGFADSADPDTATQATTRHREVVAGVAAPATGAAAPAPASPSPSPPDPAATALPIVIEPAAGMDDLPFATPASAPIVALLDEAAARHGLDPTLLRAIAWVESSYRPSVESEAGAQGVMQVMPATMDFVEGILGRELDQQRIRDNIEAGAAFLAHLLDLAHGDVRLAVAAYHEGWDGVLSDGAADVTVAYVARVMEVHQTIVAAMLPAAG